MKGGELFDHIAQNECLPESETKRLLRQILQALVYMHDKSIVHLDLKPENILLTDPESKTIKIIDFGISRIYDPKEKYKGMFGTPEFVGKV